MSYASIGASEPGRNTPRTGVRPARNRADIPRDRRTRGYIVVPRITDPCRRGPAAHRCTAALARNHHTGAPARRDTVQRSEEHTSELQSLMRISYAVFCLKKKKQINTTKKPIGYINKN